MSNSVICRCQTCNKPIEFEDTAAGQTLSCPHCGIDTVLYVPQPDVQKTATEPPPKIKNKLRHVRGTNSFALIVLLLFALGVVVAHFLPRAQLEQQGKPDDLVKLCGGEHWVMVSQIKVISFQDDWLICEVDVAAEDPYTPWKTIAIADYPFASAMVTDSLIDKKTRAVSVGRYQMGDQMYEAYDCGDIAR